MVETKRDIRCYIQCILISKKARYLKTKQSEFFVQGKCVIRL